MKTMFESLYHQLFDISPEKIRSEHIKISDKDCYFLHNIQYGDDKNNNVFDFLCPKEKNKKYPLVYLIHGGGYVGGVKEGLNEVALKLVENGYAVVNVEYTKSNGKEKKYMPTPIYEMFDLFKYIQNNKEISELIDYNNVFLFGDSSGGHIASLIANIQTNPNLKFDFNLTGGPQIKGLILTCPVFGAYKFGNPNMENALTKIVYGKNNKMKDICHNLDVITELFPPSILVSTPKDMIVRVHTNMFLKKAKELNLSVDFYDIKKGYKLNHDSMIVFLDKYPIYINKILQFLDNAVNNKFVDGVKKANIEEDIKQETEKDI